MDEIWSFMGKFFAYFGGAVVLVNTIFMFLGKKWIESKFDESIAAFKHAQDQELELFRQQFNFLLSRVSKIHEKEIDILPALWHKLQDALGSVRSLTNPYQEYPDFRFMSQDTFEEFLNQSRLRDKDRNLLRTSEDRNSNYQKAIFWYHLDEAKSSMLEFRNFMVYNRIFLSKDLRNEFGKIDKLLSTALMTRETGERAEDFKLISAAYQVLNAEAEPIVDQIENLIQARLEFTKANSSFS